MHEECLGGSKRDYIFSGFLTLHDSALQETCHPSNSIGYFPCAPETATPYHVNLPTGSGQIFGRAPVPGTVFLDFICPECLIGLRKSSLVAILMSVPEAAMNEDNLASRSKNDVGLSRQIFPVKGIAVSGSVQG